MSIRQTINQYPTIACITTLVLCVAGFAMLWRSGANDRPPAPPRQAFYSVDGGKTTFVADFIKVYPFDHNGKTAYRVGMVRYGNEKPVVGFLQRYNEAGQQKAAELIRLQPTDLAQRLIDLYDAHVEVTMPGDTNWVRATSGKGAAIIGHAKDGVMPELVFP